MGGEGLRSLVVGGDGKCTLYELLLWTCYLCFMGSMVDGDEKVEEWVFMERGGKETPLFMLSLFVRFGML